MRYRPAVVEELHEALRGEAEPDRGQGVLRRVRDLPEKGGCRKLSGAMQAVWSTND